MPLNADMDEPASSVRRPPLFTLRCAILDRDGVTVHPIKLAQPLSTKAAVGELQAD